MKFIRGLLVLTVFWGGLAAYGAPGQEEIALLTELKLKPGTEVRFMTSFNRIVKPSLAEPGNIAWYVQRADRDPSIVVFYTRWKNEEALQTHLHSKPLVDYIAETAPLLEPGYPQFTRFHPIDQLRYELPGDGDSDGCDSCP